MANVMTEDHEKCIAVGMDDYLNKPLRTEKITETLQKWLHHSDKNV